MHPSLGFLDHRPWALPTRRWQWRQSWLDLAFIHSRVDAKQLIGLLPAGLRLQEYDGTAWVGLVPFRMAGVARRSFPEIPSLSNFPELNLRTYVEIDGKPGVWFFSLDADSWPVVLGGKYIYHLPYFSARMTHSADNGWFSFFSERRNCEAQLSARFRPVGPAFSSVSGTFEHWIAERYCLYSQSRKELKRVEVHHAPWPLQKGEVLLERNTILSAANITPLPDAPVCHFSKGVDVVSFPLEKIHSGYSGSVEARYL